MVLIYLIVIFAFGLVVTGVVLLGLVEAREIARRNAESGRSD